MVAEATLSYTDLKNPMELWSTAFLADESSGDSWATASLEIGEWRRITGDLGETGRLFAEIRAGNDGLPFCVAIGTPIQPPTHLPSEGGRQRIFLPPWMAQAAGCQGCGEEVTVEWYDQGAFPAATRIVLRPHDSAFFNSDIKAELERGLTRIGVVQRGTSVTIPIEQLGGYEVTFDVVCTEPANIVLAEGDEVVLDFEEALDAPAPPAALEPEPAPAPEPSEEMVTAALQEPEPAGQRLGGAGPRLMPDGTRWNPWKHGPWEGGGAAPPLP